MDVYPGSFLGEDSHAAAAREFAAPVHTDKSSPSGGHRHKRLVAGRGCAGHMEAAHSPHVLELSNRRLRQDSANLGRWVARWRREAKRARADLQLAEQDTIGHGKKGYLFSMRCGIVTALRRNIECGTGAAAFADLLQIDACKQPIMCWVRACLALSSRRIHKRCDHFFGRCGQHALTLSTVTSIFMTGDASNAGLFQNSKLQTLKIVSRYCWAAVQSPASAERECWLDAHLFKGWEWSWMCGFGEQTIGTGWFCAKKYFNRWTPIAARCRQCSTCGPGPEQKKCRQHLLKLARRSARFLFLDSGCFKYNKHLL